MDNCVVCCKVNADTLSRITTKSIEWKKWDIQRIIEKHLWWWYLREPSDGGTLQWICGQCWQELSSFHKFYLSVEKEHNLYNHKVLHIKTDKEDLPSVVIKEELPSFENEPLIVDNLIQSEKPKRGRKKKVPENKESIRVEELPLVQIKNEHETIDQNKEEPKLEIDDLDLMDNESGDEWEQCFLDQNHSDEDFTDAENDFADPEEDILDIIYKKKSKTKTQTSKAKKILKNCRKKYTKTKKEKKVKAIKNESISSMTHVMKKNDEFIADNHFELSCSICGASLDNFNNLKIHFRKEHDILGYAMCCNKKFYKRGVLVDHINVHKDPNYFKCLQCNKALSTRRSYEKHMETHQQMKSGQLLFTCEKCDKSFLKKAVFDRHVLTHVPEEERNFQCAICNKKFASEYLRRQHVSLTHTNKYAKICDICGKLFRDSFSFIRHMAEHNGQPVAKVKCDLCGAELTSKYRLNRHMKMMHTEENQQEQICPYCSKISPNLNAHRHHVKYAHTLERKHACHMCDKKFRRPLELKEHLSTHTGEPLYTCPHCPRTFISSANMHKHRKLSHRKEWDEARLRKLQAKPFAGKKIIFNPKETPKSEVLTVDTPYPEISLIEPGSEAVPNLAVLNF